jgi:hypothetical protein
MKKTPSPTKENSFPPLNCPHCGFDLDGGDIFEKLLVEYRGDEAKALEYAGHFGWTKAAPKRFSKIVGIYSIASDRTESYQCPSCEKKIDRPPKDVRPKGVKIKELIE